MKEGGRRIPDAWSQPELVSEDTVNICQKRIAARAQGRNVRWFVSEICDPSLPTKNAHSVAASRYKAGPESEATTLRRNIGRPGCCRNGAAAGPAC